MLAAADSGPGLCHVNLARGFRGGERQTEILIRVLAGRVPQRLIARAAMPLTERLAGVPGVTVVGVSGRRAALRESAGCALVHAHETGGAQVARVRHALTATPYVITRRVDNVPKADPFTRSIYLRAARVVVLSDAIRGVLERYDPRIRVAKIPSAWSGLAADEERARVLRGSAERFVVGTIGELDHSHKGQLTLIDAAARLAATHPGIHFMLVGSGRDEARMRRAAAALRNVTFAGQVTNVGDYLAAFDILAVPSLHEGLGSIVIDAMQFGLPVVASEVGGIPDLVRHGENGLLIRPQDAQALARAIVELYTNAGMRNAMSERNRRRAEDYRPALMARRYWALYREILPWLEQGPDAS